MSEINEMSAFSQEINLVLINEIVEFVMETAATPFAYRKQLYSQALLLCGCKNVSNLQEKYGFLYLGELLERFEQRFGMSIQDRRAIAIALGYTKSIVTNEMFVGNQRADFIKSLRQQAQGDIYLTGALYLLSEDEISKKKFEEILLRAQYTRTEELIFAMSLFSDFEQAFIQLKSQVIRLLGHERNMPVLGNTLCINWLVIKLQPIVKSMRSKDLQLVRALCALPSAFFKDGSKFYKILSEYDYSPLEIAYANIHVVLEQTADKVLRLDSIVTEKIVINLFQQVFDHSEAFEEKTYQELDRIYAAYRILPIRCNGKKNLIDALGDVRIKNAKTFAWFRGHEQLANPVFSDFNILDTKWDALAKELKEADYRYLFERNLTADRDSTQKSIDRYNELTGMDYVQCYYDGNAGYAFGTLVETGIIDLWDAFQNSLEENGTVVKSQMIKQIGDYIFGLSTTHSFRFCERFFPVYGVQGYHKYFETTRSWDTFDGGLISRYVYSNSTSITLDIKRQYLKENEEGHRLVLQWLQEYLFQYKPALYIPLICGILKDTRIANLLPQEIQRKMFDFAIAQPDPLSGQIEYLKQIYLSEAELMAEKEAEEAAKEQRAKEAKAKEEQTVQAYYDEVVDGGIVSLLKFLEHYHYYWSGKPIACRIVNENLLNILEEKNSELNKTEIHALIQVFEILMQENSVTFAEIQKYILQIKEVAVHGDGGNELS